MRTTKLSELDARMNSLNDKRIVITNADAAIARVKALWEVKGRQGGPSAVRENQRLMAEPSARTVVPQKSAAPAKEAVAARRATPTRDKILAVATELFAERGYAGVSIRDIAGACCIGIPSIYHFFGDKETLYLKCYEQEFGEVEAELHASFNAAATTHDRLRAVTLKLCDILLRKREFRRLLQMGLLQDDNRGIEKITAKNFASVFKLFARCIAELGVADHGDELVMMIFALVFGQIELHRVGQMAGLDITGGGNPARLAQHVLGVALPSHDWSR